jgi:glycosyltransferase involved in cell wall biosynthesis
MRLSSARAGVESEPSAALTGRCCPVRGSFGGFGSSARDPRERKGTDTIREAFEMVRRDHPSVELATYHGKGIPQERMAETYCSADLFVDAQWYAGWNNPVAEAMACGVPVVCTDIGGVADFAFHEETAVLFPVANIERLASGIRRMMDDGELRLRMRRNAFRAVSRFDWDDSARRLHRLLERD